VCWCPNGVSMVTLRSSACQSVASRGTILASIMEILVPHGLARTIEGRSLPAPSWSPSAAGELPQLGHSPRPPSDGPFRRSARAS
jgi:hypothetical protein